MYIISFDPAIIHLAYCVIDTDTFKIIKWGKISIKQTDNDGLCDNLANELEYLDLSNGIESIVVIEQQPMTNIKTITICAQIRMYYTCKKILGDDIKNIICYHAKNKEKYYKPREGDEPIPDKVIKLKDGYNKTKKLLVEHCRRIMKHNNETEKWIEFFETNKKKDDLADSYVMALSYLNSSKTWKYK